MTTTRRDFLTAAAATTGAAVTPDLTHAHQHEHDHEHQAVPSDPTLRVKALKSLMVENGLVAAGIDSACHTATVLALNTTMRKSEIRKLRWEQIDLEKRVLTVGHSKTDAGEGLPIPLNSTAFEALVRWAGRYPDTRPEHYVFPWCESRQIDSTRPTKGWRTAWRRALKQAGFHCRFHDLRHTCITKLSEGQASDMTLMAIAGHVSKRMLERYSHIRMQAKRTALDAIVQRSERAVFEEAVHQNVHQLEASVSGVTSKSLN